MTLACCWVLYINHGFLSPKVVSKDLALQENCKCYRKSAIRLMIYTWKEDLLSEPYNQISFLLLVFRMKISFENNRISYFSSFSLLFMRVFSKCWTNMDTCWGIIDLWIGSDFIVEWRAVGIINEIMDN